MKIENVTVDFSVRTWAIQHRKSPMKLESVTAVLTVLGRSGPASAVRTAAPLGTSRALRSLGMGRRITAHGLRPTTSRKRGDGLSAGCSRFFPSRFSERFQAGPAN
eukprot:SAG31_NODE_1857_length_7062_cov_6.624587_1_plen_106_part_00